MATVWSGTPSSCGERRSKRCVLTDGQGAQLGAATRTLEPAITHSSVDGTDWNEHPS